MTLGEGAASTRGTRRSLGKFHYEGIVALAGLALVWQFASLFLPHFLFPSVPEIAERLLAIFTSWQSIGDALATSARILAGLTGAFLLGTMLALPMARSATFERYAYPLLNFIQGIPALSWVVFAIIWFHGIEFRIFFIMVMTTLPAFTFQVLDAFRAMSKDLFEMRCRSGRRGSTLFRAADLRRRSCRAFSPPGRSISATPRASSSSPSWSARPAASATNCCSSSRFSTWPARWPGRCVLVLFVLIVQGFITLIETQALRYRAFAERAM